jgi:hypothetical protein
LKHSEERYISQINQAAAFDMSRSPSHASHVSADSASTSSSASGESIELADYEPQEENELDSDNESGSDTAGLEARNHMDSPVPDTDTDNEDEDILPTDSSQESSGLQPDDVDMEIRELQYGQAFIRFIKSATIAQERLPDDVRAHLCHAPSTRPHLDVAEQYSLELLIDMLNSSKDTYENVCRTAERNTRRISPDTDLKLLSRHSAERLLEDLTGVVPICDDMCINSCTAFTGPFEKLESCPYCAQPRYDEERKPRQSCYTIPIGPQLQAAFSSPESAEQAEYRRRETEKLLRVWAENGHEKAEHILKDWLHGRLYREYVQNGTITSNDVVVMLSIDGAQLMALKLSDCWIYIWILLDLSPDTRYSKIQIRPGGIVPGPFNPKNYDSFLCTGLAHLNALQKDGLSIWNAARRERYTSRPFLAFTLADGPALSKIHGTVGHPGMHGCRDNCPHTSRLYHCRFYFPACQRPHGPGVQASEPDDIDPRRVRRGTPEEYAEKVRRILSARDSKTFARIRKETGISKPSVFTALERMFPFPYCLTSDVMHLNGNNITSLFHALWRGIPGGKDRSSSDDPTHWDWAVLADADEWSAHGLWIEYAARYLPPSFERTPRNPAEKWNTGYKTWEALLWFWSLAPGFLHGVLPEPYFTNYCTLVKAGRGLMDRERSVKEIQQIALDIICFYEQFEDVYYQGNSERMWMVRQALHTLLHCARLYLDVGPLGLVAQWVMERTIGDLKRQMRQPSNPYANLAHIALSQCQINTLYDMYPELAPQRTKEQISMSPKHRQLGDGYVLLRSGDSRARPVSEAEARSIRSYIEYREKNGEKLHWPSHGLIWRWGRLLLPNQQIARCLWKEEKRNPLRSRNSRNAKVCVCVLRLRGLHYVLTTHRSSDPQSARRSVRLPRCSTSSDCPMSTGIGRLLRLPCYPSGQILTGLILPTLVELYGRRPTKVPTRLLWWMLSGYSPWWAWSRTFSMEKSGISWWRSQAWESWRREGGPIHWQTQQTTHRMLVMTQTSSQRKSPCTRTSLGPFSCMCARSVVIWHTAHCR